MRRKTSAQALVEFGLTATILLLLVLGIIDLSYFFTSRTQSDQAVLAAARYASAHPSAWSNAPNPPANSIQGTLRASLTTTNLPNDDSHIAISYFLADSTPDGTKCGHYSAALGTFVPDNGHSQADCLLPGTTIRVVATYNYAFLTPVLKAAFAGPSITATGLVREEV